MRVWWVAILAGLAGFGLARWTGDAVPAAEPTSRLSAETGVVVENPPGEANASAATATDAQAPAMPQPTPEPRALVTPPEAPAPDGPKLALDAVAFLREWPARLDDLAARAKTGEARALIELAEALEYCFSASAAVARVRYTPMLAGNFADATLQGFFVEVEGQCKAWKQRNPWLGQLETDSHRRMQEYREDILQKRIDPNTPRPPSSAPDALRRQAADAGDAIAEGLTNNDDVRRGCGEIPGNVPQNQAYWQCLHAAARERLAAIFTRRDPREIEAIPRILSGSPLLFGSEFIRPDSYNSETNNVRWILTACEFSLDCGPAGRAMRWACASYGACGYRHFRDYAADRLLPPATMRMVDGQVRRLVNLILAGDVDTILGPPPKYGIPGRR